MHTRFRLISLVALVLMTLLSACAAQPQPTPTPEATLDTTALAQSIADSIFGTLTAQPTNTHEPSATPSPSPTVTASYTASPDAVATTLAQFSGQLEDQQTLLDERAANLPATVLAQVPTAAPTLDMQVIVGTAQAGVIETLVANVTQQVAQQSTLQAAQQATGTAIASRPADIETDDDPFWGPEDAQVTIIAFSDYTCPHCRNFALQTLPQLKAAYEDRVKFVFRDAPILGPNSGWTALAAECADDQGQFWGYHDLLFTNQSSIDRAALTSFAEQLGMNVEAFDACVDNQTHINELRNDLEAAQNAGLTGTPTFFINGRRIEGAQPYEVFALIIDQELEALGLPTGPAEEAVEVTEEVAVEVTEEVATEAAEEAVEVTEAAVETAAPTATPRS